MLRFACGNYNIVLTLHLYTNTHTDTQTHTHIHSRAHADLNFAIFWKDREIKYANN